MALLFFYIKNLDHIIAWHGKEKGLETEKEAAKELLLAIEHAHFEKKPFVANFDKNFYVAICRSSDTKKVSDLIASLDITSYIPQHGSVGNEAVHSTLEPTTLEERSFTSVEEYFAKLKQKYEKIVF